MLLQIHYRQLRSGLLIVSVRRQRILLLMRRRGGLRSRGLFWSNFLLYHAASPGSAKHRQEVAVDAVVASDTPGQDQEEGQHAQDRVRAYSTSHHEVQVHKEAEEASNTGQTTDDQAQAIVDQRQGDTRTPGVNILTSPEQIGVAPVGAQTYAFTGGRLRFIFTDPRTGDAYQSSLVLTPNHIERPIWIENARTRHLQPEPDPDDELQDFPEIPRLAS